MATLTRNVLPYSVWLKAFKAELRKLFSGVDDEVDGYLNTGDFSNYHQEGLSPSEAAESELNLTEWGW